MDISVPKAILNRITVRDFKRIAEVSIDLAPITALVGCNGSGKSSVLQAAQLGVAVLQQAADGTYRNGKPKFRTNVAYNSILFRPTGNFLDLKRGTPATQNQGYSICYECDYVHNEEKKKEKVDVTICRGKGATVSVRRSGDDNFSKLLAEKTKPFAILASGISGIPIREEWRTRGFLDATAMHGDANMYLRTVLDHLRKEEVNNSWDDFQNAFHDCFDGARIYVEHDNIEDRYVEVKITHQDSVFTLDMAALGMLQVIQILAYTFLYKPPLLLLDEPDAHLHADGQIRLCNALRRVAEKFDTRIVLASHSSQLIQHFADDKVAKIVWVDNGKVVQHRRSKPDYPILMNFGALSLGNKVFNTSIKTIFLTEDTKADRVSILAEANGAPEKIAIHPYHGCGSIHSARILAKMISDMRPDANIVLHRDRDYRTKEEVKFELAMSVGNLPDNAVEIFTPLTDVEHSFLQVSHLAEIFKSEIELCDIENIISEEMERLKSELKNAITGGRKIIEMNLYSSDRKKAKPEWTDSGMSSSAPKVGTFIPRGKNKISFKLCHGKTLMRAVQTRLSQKIGGPHDRVTERIYTQTEHLKDQRWIDAFSQTV